MLDTPEIIGAAVAGTLAVTSAIIYGRSKKNKEKAEAIEKERNLKEAGKVEIIEPKFKKMAAPERERVKVRTFKVALVQSSFKSAAPSTEGEVFKSTYEFQTLLYGKVIEKAASQHPNVDVKLFKHDDYKLGTKSKAAQWGADFIMEVTVGSKTGSRAWPEAYIPDSMTKYTKAFQDSFRTHAKKREFELVVNTIRDPNQRYYNVVTKNADSLLLFMGSCGDMDREEWIYRNSEAIVNDIIKSVSKGEDK